MILWERLKENLYSLQARPRNIYISWTAGKDQYEVRFVFDEQMILSAFEKVFGSDYPQRDDFDVVELYEELYGEGKLPKGDFTIHIDNEGNPTRVSLKTEKGEMSVPTDKMQILVIKNDKLIYKSSNYNESDWCRNIIVTVTKSIAIIGRCMEIIRNVFKTSTFIVIF